MIHTPFYNNTDWVLLRAHNPFLNPASLIVWLDAKEGQGEMTAGTMDDALEDLEDEKHVIFVPVPTGTG